MDLITVLVSLLAVDLPAAGPGSVEELVQSVANSVVAIEVERSKDVPPSPFQPKEVSPQGRQAYWRPKGPCSGILLDREGHVLTSHYNVAGELKSVRVILASGASFSAKLLGRCEQDDAALLQLEGDLSRLPIDLLELGGADGDAGPRAGQIVFAFGRSPDPRQVTATRGIVSAPARNGGRAIQTDAELNYGNTGGPVVGLDGRIMAMAAFVGHTQPQWGLNSGVGFGVTARALREILPRLKAGESISAFRRGFLGIQFNPEASLGSGAQALKVLPNGAAAKAGVLKDDVIEEIDGVLVYDFDHLRRLIFARKPGDRVLLTVRRGGEILKINAELGAMQTP